MENLNIEESILQLLYYKHFNEGDTTLDALEKWAVQKKFEKQTFMEQYEHLLKKDYVTYHQDDGTARLTPKGVLYTEKAGLVPAQMISRNRQSRKSLVHALATHLTTHGTYVTVEELLCAAKLEGQYINGNIDLLVRLGYARWIIPSVNLSINAKVCAKQAELTQAH